MDTLKKKRSALKGKATRLFNILHAKIDECDVEELNIYKEQTNELWVELNDLNTNIVIECKSETEINENEGVYDEIATKIENVKIKIARQLKAKNESSHVNSQNPNSQNSKAESSSVKLPRIDLPTFYGNFTEWLSFRDLFLATIHNNATLSNAQKLQYLKFSLKGQASVLIQAVQITDDNYPRAWKSVCDRYENEAEIITSTLDKLFSQPNLVQESANGLRKLLDTTNQCLSTLEILKQPIQHWDTILVYFLRKKLDPETLRQFTLSLKKGELPSYKSFETFVEHRAGGLASLSLNVSKHPSSFPPAKRGAAKYDQGKGHEFPSKPKDKVGSHFTASNACSFCKDGIHSLYFCEDFKNANFDRKMEFVRENKLCINCLRYGHYSQKCKSRKCTKCNELHNTLLHVTQNTGEEESKDELSVTNHCSQSKTRTSSVLLPTAIVKMYDQNGRSQTCRALIDTASERSFVREACVQLLGLPRQRANVKLTGLTSSSLGSSKGLVQFKIAPTDNSNVLLDVDAFVLPKITCDLPQYSVDSSLASKFQHLLLADREFCKPGAIDILLGADMFPKILRSGHFTEESGSLTALETIFGWIILGKVTEMKPTHPLSISSHFTSCDSGFEIKKFWELEETPISSPFSEEERECISHFEKTHERDRSGRYIVKLPFKCNPKVLGDSRDIAQNRLKQLEKRFKRQPELLEPYANFMKEYLTLNHMEEIPEDEIDLPAGKSCYLPHHCVKALDSKFRVVFDASAKTTTNVSLNDNLLVGPVIQDNIFNIILKFREHNIALKADVSKMYRQIRVHETDCEFQRIVWRDSPSEPIKDYRLLTVTYGTASAPFLATKCLQQLAIDEGKNYPFAADSLLEDFYVDDLMTGADTEENAINLRIQLNELLSKGGFELRKWSSNNPSVLSGLKTELLEIHPHQFNSDNSIKTLGILWYPVSDTFSFRVSLKPDSEPHTKRKLLSTLSAIFDPLGWITPISIAGKIMIQRLWKANLEWDDPLPCHLSNSWSEFTERLKHLDEVNLPRFISCDNPAYYELHGFCDASEKAFAAVIYFRVVDVQGNITTNILAAKSRVAPLKQISLPRLELCGAVLLAKLMKATMEGSRLQFRDTTCWSDSTIVLAWLSSQSSRWKTFVANRVSEIHRLLPKTSWSHVRSENNPADCASRGITPAEFSSYALWWKGPDFLTASIEVPKNQICEEKKEVLAEERKSVSCNTSVKASQNDDFNLLSKFSSLSKLKRVTAYCFRFISNCRRPKHERNFNFLTSHELDHALKFWIKNEQDRYFQADISRLKPPHTLPSKSKLLSLNPFIDKSGLLRVGGRLCHAAMPENQKFPILLPPHSHLTKLLIEWFHIANLHAGPQLLQSCILRQYWIISARNVIRKYIRLCLTCVRLQAQTATQMLGNLPPARVTPSRPFLNCGVDFAGPFIIRMSKGTRAKTSKAYLALFVCFATRAIHCELVSDLSADAFLAALRRFVSRRGKCSDIYSDCGSNFIGAKKKLDELTAFIRSRQTNEVIARHLTDDGINWHFNPPAAPHMGGIWEAGIKSVKFHMKRIIGGVILTYEELYTIIVQIEACLNSRPLSPVSNDPSDLATLTPGHFLIGGPLTAVPENDFLTSKLNRLTRWQLTQRLVQHFWKRWSSEYVSRLQQRPKWCSRQRNIEIGDLVLLKNENLPPLKWRIGRIVEVFPGKDDCVRVVSVKTVDGLYKRPVTKLCRLPLDNN